MRSARDGKNEILDGQTFQNVSDNQTNHEEDDIKEQSKVRNRGIHLICRRSERESVADVIFAKIA